MVKKLKRAFTITELVIVIAVIAILAAVLIPTFTSLIQKANQSNDTSNVKNMNTLLAAAEATDGKPDTMFEAIEVIKEGGYDLEKLTPTGEGYDIVWDQDANRLFMIGDDGKLIGEGEANEITEHLWTVISEAPAQDGAYSVYLLDGFVGPITHSAGVDVGSNADIDVTISMESNAQKDIIVRTNGGNLIVNAGISDVGHYGAAQTAAVQSVGENSYHEYGTVGALTLNKGRAVLEQSVANVTVEPAAGQNAKLEVGQNAEVAQLTVNATAGNVQLKNSGTIKNFNTTDENLTVEGNAPESTATYTPVTFTTTAVEGGLEISGVEGEVPASIVIPAYIDGTPVVSIGFKALANTENLESVVISEGITLIDKGAFLSSGLQDIKLPDSLKEIVDSAFKSCENLESVELPSGFEVLGAFAFSSCTSLKNISLPESLQTIGNGAFQETSLTRIAIPSSVKVLNSDLLKNCKDLQSVTLNEGLESIYGSVFRGCTSLTDIEIPDSVKYVGIRILNGVEIPSGFTFEGCTSLETVKIGDGVSDLTAMSLFSGCTSLQSLTLGKSVQSISSASFTGCDNLAEIIIDKENPYLSSKGNCFVQKETNTIIWGFKNTDIAASGATSIGDSAFYECAGLTEITIPASIREIGEEAFYGCENLRLLVLECNTIGGEKNSSIGAKAFYGCTALEEIRVGQYVSQVEFEYNSEESSYTSYFGNTPALQKLTVDERNEFLYAEGNCIIEKATKTLVLGCKTSVIPADVVKIGSYAFYGKGLTSLNIPESVTAIGIYAFAGGNTITTLRIPETVRNIDMYAFENCGIETLVFDPTVSFGIFTFSGNEFKTIYCLGTQEEWNALCNLLMTTDTLVGNRNLAESAENIYYYSATPPEAGTEGNYWHYDADGITPVLWGTQA